MTRRDTTKVVSEIEARVVRSDNAAALAVLAKVPDRPPPAGDELVQARLHLALSISACRA